MFKAVDFISVVRGVLEREGYLLDDKDDWIEALQQYRKEHPIEMPKTPSLNNQYDEAKCVKCRDAGFISRYNKHGSRMILVACECNK